MVNDASKSWWHTLPGILTAIAGVITASAALITALYQIGYFSDNVEKQKIIEQAQKPGTSESTSTMQLKNKGENKGLVGCWHWSNGDYIRISTNGSAYTRNATKGEWRQVDSSAGLYEIIWPPLTDNLVLNEERTFAKGTNSFGFPVTIEFLGDGSGLVGKWKYVDNGIEVELGANGKAKAIAWQGTWEDKGGSLVIEWPIIDKAFLSSTGSTLTVQNQFGSVTANRDTSCDSK